MQINNNSSKINNEILNKIFNILLIIIAFINCIHNDIFILSYYIYYIHYTTTTTTKAENVYVQQ